MLPRAVLGKSVRMFIPMIWNSLVAIIGASLLAILL